MPSCPQKQFASDEVGVVGKTKGRKLTLKMWSALEENLRVQCPQGQEDRRVTCHRPPMQKAGGLSPAYSSPQMTQPHTPVYSGAEYRRAGKIRKVLGHLIRDGSAGTYRKVRFCKQCPRVLGVRRHMGHLAGRCSWAEGSIWAGPKKREIGADSAVPLLTLCL